jgi:hypothetical protein
MAKLSAAARKRLPSSTFAGGIDESKGKGDAKRRRFPIPDKAHARSALRLLPKAKGLSSADRTRIRARANAKLGKSRGLRKMNDG